MQHPGGFAFRDIPQYKQGFFYIYSEISLTGTRAELQQRIDNLVEVTGNAISENVSRIKKKLVRAVGDELAAHYCISGANGAKKLIPLNRSLVTYES